MKRFNFQYDGIYRVGKKSFEPIRKTRKFFWQRVGLWIETVKTWQKRFGLFGSWLNYFEYQPSQCDGDSFVRKWKKLFLGLVKEIVLVLLKQMRKLLMKLFGIFIQSEFLKKIKSQSHSFSSRVCFTLCKLSTKKRIENELRSFADDWVWLIRGTKLVGILDSKDCAKRWFSWDVFVVLGPQRPHVNRVRSFV